MWCERICPRCRRAQARVGGQRPWSAFYQSTLPHLHACAQSLWVAGGNHLLFMLLSASAGPLSHVAQYALASRLLFLSGFISADAFSFSVALFIRHIAASHPASEGVHSNEPMGWGDRVSRCLVCFLAHSFFLFFHSFISIDLFVLSFFLSYIFLWLTFFFHSFFFVFLLCVYTNVCS